MSRERALIAPRTNPLVDALVRRVLAPRRAPIAVPNASSDAHAGPAGCKVARSTQAQAKRRKARRTVKASRRRNRGR